MKHSKHLWYELIKSLVAFSLLTVFVASLWRDNLLLFSVMLAEGLVALWLWHDRYDLSFLFVIGGLGSLAEAAFVQFGVWRYANPTLLGIPLWFPVAFGTAGLIGGRLARTLAGIWEEISPSGASET
jgi:hypothetical protein